MIVSLRASPYGKDGHHPGKRPETFQCPGAKTKDCDSLHDYVHFLVKRMGCPSQHLDVSGHRTTLVVAGLEKTKDDLEAKCYAYR